LPGRFPVLAAAGGRDCSRKRTSSGRTSHQRHLVRYVTARLVMQSVSITTIPDYFYRPPPKGPRTATPPAKSNRHPMSGRSDKIRYRSFMPEDHIFAVSRTITGYLRLHSAPRSAGLRYCPGIPAQQLSNLPPDRTAASSKASEQERERRKSVRAEKWHTLICTSPSPFTYNSAAGPQKGPGDHRAIPSPYRHLVAASTP